LRPFFFKVDLYKPYLTLEEAINGLANVKKFFDELKEKEKHLLEEDIEDSYRNENGVAVISVYNGENGGGRYFVEVDDIDWKEFIHYEWHSALGYPAGKIEGIIRRLHEMVFIRMNPEFSYKDYFNTIDHIDVSRRNRKRSNLRQILKNRLKTNLHPKISIYLIRVYLWNGVVFATK